MKEKEKEKTILFEIPEDFTKKESYAERRRILLKKHKKFLRDKEALVDFEGPCLILMRQGKKAEWHEKATGGKFYFTHSDGEERFIILDPRFLQTMEYGGRSFQLYVCHEDFPTALPDDPIVTTELVALMYEKVLQDIRKWKIEEAKAKALQLKGWAILAAVLGGIVILYVILKPTGTSEAITPAINETINQTVQQAATVIKTNITRLG